MKMIARDVHGGAIAVSSQPRWASLVTAIEKKHLFYSLYIGEIYVILMKKVYLSFNIKKFFIISKINILKQQTKNTSININCK